MSRTINGCPIVLERNGRSLIRHPQGFMVYQGFRLGTWQTLKGAMRHMGD